MSEPPIEINYLNYKGERSLRRIIPRDIRYGSTEHHKEPQWLLDAWDVGKQAERTFALKDIQRWAFPAEATITELASASAGATREGGA